MEKFATEVEGYSKEEVNEFLTNVISEIEANLSRIKHQEQEISNLKNELYRYKEVEDRLNNALNQAEQSSMNIKRIAEKEADIIVSEARYNANRIVNDALIRAEKMELRRETLERNMRICKKKLKALAEEQLEMVEEIEILEI